MIEFNILFCQFLATLPKIICNNAIVWIWMQETGEDGNHKKCRSIENKKLESLEKSLLRNIGSKLMKSFFSSVSHSMIGAEFACI